MSTRPSTLPTAIAVRARDIIAMGPSALLPLSGKEAWQFGKLWALSPAEHDGLLTVRDRIKNYLAFVEPKRPLCVAVFGPPGSGKSTGVKEIHQLLKKAGSPLALAVLNLTQFASTAELAQAVVAEMSKAGTDVPIIFFDEFDAALGGASLGWLSWFLAPMQDGMFRADGKAIALPRAVYVFAGGTADTMKEFGARDPHAFRLAKGPDFVSRLHCYIDIRGPNDLTAREYRRGIALWLALKSAGERTGRKLELEDDFVDELVNAARYRHGQRSVEAIITMMAEQATPPAKLGRNALRPQFLCDMQVDRGPLDPVTIEGLIGLSGGGFPTDREHADRDATWESLARSLWELGATIAYGGDWKGLTQVLIDIKLPNRLRSSPAEEPRLEVHAATAPPKPDPRVTVVIVPEPPLRGATKPVRTAAHLFRRRWQAGCRCRARVLLSGRTEGYSGRMPGIIEEAVIALALRQPIYLLGGLGGAAALLGELLGLANAARHPPGKLKPGPSLRLDKAAHLFRPDGFKDLPLSIDEALSYIASRAIGGHGWTWNGLTVEENRRLFSLRGSDTKERAEAIELVRTGLVRVFDR